MLRRLGSQCQNEHKHGSLLNGKAAGAAIYPQKLCVEILKGIRDTTTQEDLEKEMEDESRSRNMINSLVHDRHPWGGCITSEVVAPRGDDERRGAPKPVSTRNRWNIIAPDDDEDYEPNNATSGAPARNAINYPLPTSNIPVKRGNKW